jgi:hypothetical protein
LCTRRADPKSAEEATDEHAAEQAEGVAPGHLTAENASCFIEQAIHVCSSVLR